MTEVEGESTKRLHGWVTRLQAGDESALAELLARFKARLWRLAHTMRACFPDVAREVETDDIFQEMAIRLWRALKAEMPNDTAHLVRLAALQINRELIDLSRKHRPVNPSRAGLIGPYGTSIADDRAAPTETDAGEIERWTAFHESAADLPGITGEVFRLTYYAELSRAEAAENLGVTERTVNNHWRKALLLLHKRLGGDLPA